MSTLTDSIEADMDLTSHIDRLALARTFLAGTEATMSPAVIPAQDLLNLAATLAPEEAPVTEDAPSDLTPIKVGDIVRLTGPNVYSNNERAELREGVHYRVDVDHVDSDGDIHVEWCDSLGGHGGYIRATSVTRVEDQPSTRPFAVGDKVKVTGPSVFTQSRLLKCYPLDPDEVYVVERAVDGEGDVRLTRRGYIQATSLTHYVEPGLPVEHDPDNDRVFVLDEEGLNSLDGLAIVVNADGVAWFRRYRESGWMRMHMESVSTAAEVMRGGPVMVLQTELGSDFDFVV